MTAAALTLQLTPSVWTLESTLWLDVDVVELWFTADDGSDAAVQVRVVPDLPSTASEPAYREELIVLDVDGAAFDVECEVERCRNTICDEFWRGYSPKGRC